LRRASADVTGMKLTSLFNFFGDGSHMKRSKMAWNTQALALMMLGGSLAAPGTLLAQDADEEESSTELGTTVVEGEVNDQLEILPTEPNGSVFGFNKTLLETPRSVTSISNEMLNRFNLTELDDLVALSPGSFTQSFFGVAGSLDVRGTPGEVYFRGVRRIDNPGNYPTPIGATDRIDIVRGPASPIYGPSKIGGYLNFIPKSARADTGQYMPKAMGELNITRGSWDKDILTAEVGGPGKIGDKAFGYYVYAETEDSGSYYENSSTDQSIYQASFNMDLTPKSRIEFGGMYQEYEGNQVAGWNRLTQDLIDNGTYITGLPPSLDTNGDGILSADESAAGNLAIFYPFGSSDPNVAFGDVSQQSAETVLNDLADHPNMALINPGTTHIDGSQVLVQEDDELTDDVITLYFDFIHDFDSGLTMTNKSFYESLKNNNENQYGFSQFADTWAFEDQLIFAYQTMHGDKVEAAYQFSPSIRYQDFEHGDNFAFEYFDRRDITQPGSPVDRRSLATRDPGLEPYSSHTKGNFTDLAAAVLADYTFFSDIHLLAGARYDQIDVESTCLEGADCDDLGITGIKYDSSDDAFSWSGSLSYDIPKTGMTPYFTKSKQTTLIVGQGGQVPADIVMEGHAVADSKLTEYGVKASLWGGRIYTTVAHFKQERVDYNAQDTVTNNTTEAKGWEFEFRGVINDNFAVTGAWTNLEVHNLTAAQNGNQFSFAGAEDLPEGVDPALMFGGVINGLVLTEDAEKAGVPENIYSVYLIYTGTTGWMSGLTATVGATHVDSVYSGFSQSVKLPEYTLVNAGINYEMTHWTVGLSGKNLTNEEYYRSNFPDLFGSSVVLPETPRNWLVTLGYKF